MNTRVTATIGGQAHDLQFHSAHVHQRLFDQCTLQLELGFGERNADPVFKKALDSWLGEELVLTIKDELDKNIEKKYAGTITALSLSSNALLLEAKSADHVLAVGRKHKTFSGMQINDIVNQVVRAYGIPFDFTGADHSKQFHFLQQYDETDYDLLKRLADYDGCVMFHNGEKFVYAKSLGGRKQVKLGLEEVEDVVLGCTLDITKWKGSYYDHEKHLDPGGGYAQSQKDQLRSSHPVASKVQKKAEKVYGTVTEEVFHTALSTQNDIGKFVSTRDRQSAGNLVRLTGETNHPMVAIGRTISCESHPLLKDPVVVTEMHASFAGNVYGARFTALPENAVIPQHAAPPMQPSVPAQGQAAVPVPVAVPVQAPVQPRPAAPMQPAAVVDNKDPLKLGRVKVRYNWADQDQTFWARVVSIGAGGDDHGTHFTPRIADQVLVGFENGDPSLPIVLGALYHSEKKPLFVTDNGTEEVLVAKTPISTIRIVDKQGSEEVILSMKDKKNVVRMELNQPKITVESIDGTVVVHSKTIQLTADDNLEFKAKKIEISAQQEIKTSAGTDFQIDAGGNLTAKASANAELSGTSGVKISGTQVESQATATNVIKGSVVQIN